MDGVFTKEDAMPAQPTTGRVQPDSRIASEIYPATTGSHPVESCTPMVPAPPPENSKGEELTTTTLSCLPSRWSVATRPGSRSSIETIGYFSSRDVTYSHSVSV